MTAAPASIRSAWATLGLALLALRLLSPAGFMPSFDHGAVTIVACPDGASESPMPRHSSRHPAKIHQLCPYAAAATPAALGPAPAVLTEEMVFLAVPSIARPFRLVASAKDREPPHLRGPPVPA